MNFKKHHILFLLTFFTSTIYAQLDSMQGCWLSTEGSDTTIMQVKEFQNNNLNESNLKGGLQKSIKRGLIGVFYYVKNDDSLKVMDAYGNVLCTSQTFSFTNDTWIVEGCSQLIYKRITKKEFKYFSKLIDKRK